MVEHSPQHRSRLDDLRRVAKSVELAAHRTEHLERETFDRLQYRGFLSTHADQPLQHHHLRTAYAPRLDLVGCRWQCQKSQEHSDEPVCRSVNGHPTISFRDSPVPAIRGTPTAPFGDA